MQALETIMLGVLIGLLYFEFFKIFPGGLIAPGFCALFILEPLVLINLLAVVCIVLAVMWLLSFHLVLFGRRALCFAVILGYLCSWIFHELFSIFPPQSAGVFLLAFLVPGEIAHECRRQGAVPTLVALLAVVLVIRVLLLAGGLLLSR